MKIADFYIRVSTEEQKTTGFSQRYQEEILRSYCAINAIEIDRVFFDDHSAKTFNRPSWNKLFASYQSKTVSTPRLLLITKWDRFSRNTAEAYQMLNKLQKLHIEVIAVEQPLDSSIPESKLLMTLFLTYPEVENDRRAINIKQGIEQGLKEGRWMGLAPVGYINKITETGIKYIEPSEPYATYIRTAFFELAKGTQAVTAVYKRLREKGFSKSFHCFNRAIHNPLYCGKIAVKSHDSRKPVYIMGKHTAIISDILFFQVQELLTRRKRRIRKGKADIRFPLRGVLLCPICHKYFTGSGSTGRHKQTYYYYHCKNGKHPRIPIAIVHSSFIEFIGQLSPTAYFSNVYHSMVADQLRETLTKLTTKKNKLTIALETLTYKTDKSKSLLLSENIDIEDYQVIKRDLETQKDILKTTYRIASNEINRITQATPAFFDNFTHLDHLFGQLNINDQKDLVGMLFSYGLIYSTGCFSLANMAAGLQLIYDDKVSPLRAEENAPSAPQQTVQTYTPKRISISQAMDRIRETHKSVTDKEIRQIITYLDRIIQLSINILFDTHPPA